ncbi:MAG: magnesium-translocating P-type ATPase [Patescibacteria group bacterium]
MNSLRLVLRHSDKTTAHQPGEKILLSLKQAAYQNYKQVLHNLNSKLGGLDKNEVKHRLIKYGLNITTQQKPKPITLRLILAFKDPLAILLLALAFISLLTNNPASVVMILVMVLISAVIKFWQETRAQLAADKLEKIIKSQATVIRDGETKKISLPRLVPGDIISLTAGDMIPADIRLIESQNLLIDQSMLTGESLPVIKTEDLEQQDLKNPLYFSNICFMGTNVDSGIGKAVVVATGQETYFGSMVKTILADRELTNFDKWIKNFTKLIMRFVLIMVPAVFLINLLTKGDFWQSFLFALAVAVGLAPEMLPMIVTVNLSNGALRMAKKKVVIKHLSAIQNFGAMDILCTDKTGTLTLNRIILEKHCDINHQESPTVLKYAYLNSYFQTGLKNILDQAILHYEDVPISQYKKVAEIPFDFERKLMSIVVKDREHHYLIAKGAAEEIFARCDSYELAGQSHHVNKQIFIRLKKDFEQLSNDGFRVLGLAIKKTAVREKKYTHHDEKELTFLGYLAFLDPPKPSTKNTIKELAELGVDIKILTGDNHLITQQVCQQVDFKIKGIVTDQEIESASDQLLSKLVEENNIFARLSPLHKERVIRALRQNQHTVGYLGDGINDAPALRAADVGISVDGGANIAKESSDIILLEKNLLVLKDGVLEGRRIFSNIIKYIRMAASSNFGNMLSVVGSSIFLPFLPMLPLQILLNNLLYDISQTTIPTDNVDKEQLKRQETLSTEHIKKFILSIGPISSIFDYITYFTMILAFNCWFNPALFHTGWFIESLLSQTLIIHVIRTRRLPFIQSRASWPLIITTLAISAIGIYLPFSPLANYLGLVMPPPRYWLYLAIILLLYFTSTQIAKNWLLKKMHIN